MLFFNYVIAIYFKINSQVWMPFSAIFTITSTLHCHKSAKTLKPNYHCFSLNGQAAILSLQVGLSETDLSSENSVATSGGQLSGFSHHALYKFGVYWYRLFQGNGLGIFDSGHTICLLVLTRSFRVWKFFCHSYSRGTFSANV